MFGNLDIEIFTLVHGIWRVLITFRLVSSRPRVLQLLPLEKRLLLLALLFLFLAALLLLLLGLRGRRIRGKGCRQR